MLQHVVTLCKVFKQNQSALLVLIFKVDYIYGKQIPIIVCILKFGDSYYFYLQVNMLIIPFRARRYVAKFQKKKIITVFLLLCLLQDKTKNKCRKSSGRGRCDESIDEVECIKRVLGKMHGYTQGVVGKCKMNPLITHQHFKNCRKFNCP